MSEQLVKTFPSLRCGDNRASIISLYKACQNGYEPPTTVTLEEFKASKLLPDSDPFKAFCNPFLTWGAKGDHQLAKNNEDRKALPQESHDVLMRQMATLKSVLFEDIDFLSIEPGPTDEIMYCDAPYADTFHRNGSHYKSGAFCHLKYYHRIRQWSEFTDIFVSEYDFPFGQMIFEKTIALNCMRSDKRKGRTQTERLYYIKRGNIK